jgi:6-phosphofructokinase 1
MTKRVAILTGGGDVPGLNTCLKSLVYRLVDLGYEPIGVRKGWEGLVEYNPRDPTTYSEHFIELTKNMVRPIDRTPGSFLHSSRLDPRLVVPAMVPEHLRQPGSESQDLTDHIQDVFKRLDFKALIVIGDDDTLHYAAYLSQRGIPLIAIPKTIHNNIKGTDYTLGFSTSLARGVALIHELRSLAASREQTVVIETFAARNGYSALLMALLSGADRVIIPEIPYDPDKLAAMVQQDKRETPANYSVVLVCDGSRPTAEKIEKYKLIVPPGSIHDTQPPVQEQAAFLPGQVLAGSGMVVAELLSHISKEEVIHQPLTYLLRTGTPDGQDLLGAFNFAFTAARLLHEEKYGRMAAFVQDQMWTHVDLGLAGQGIKEFDFDSWYDAESYKPHLALIWSVDENN